MENKTLLENEQLEAQAAERAARNKKIFIFSAIGVGVVAVIIGVVFTVRHFGSQKQDEAMGKADVAMMLATDSASQAKALAQYKKIADDGSYDANERAQLIVAIDLYQNRKYKEALEYLDKPSISSDIIAAGVYSLKGDCHANLKELDEALDCYDDGLEEADENPVITPFLLKKKANIYHEQKKYEDEMTCYETILKNYPQAIPDAEKYYQRAKNLAGK